MEIRNMKPEKKAGENTDPVASKPVSTESEEALERGRMAIEIRKKVSGKTEEEIEKEEREDAERWRNEG